MCLGTASARREGNHGPLTPAGRAAISKFGPRRISDTWLTPRAVTWGGPRPLSVAGLGPRPMAGRRRRAECHLPGTICHQDPGRSANGTNGPVNAGCPSAKPCQQQASAWEPEGACTHCISCADNKAWVKVMSPARWLPLLAGSPGGYGAMRARVAGVSAARSSSRSSPQNPHNSGSAAMAPHRKPTDETALPGTRRHRC
jgi:hypothetical protein